MEFGNKSDIEEQKQKFYKLRSTIFDSYKKMFWSKKEFKMKKYYFLSGMQRSGNTLLSTILSQNPKIYSSKLSPMAQYMWDNG
jgi:hypothetical protein